MPNTPRRWQLVGNANVGSDHEPEFPKPPVFRPECVIETKNKRGITERTVPGIYKLTFDKEGKEYVWIGKTKDLLRCPFHDYCNPVDGVERDNVVHDILVDAGGARIEVIPECDLGTTRDAAEVEEQDEGGKNQPKQLLLNSRKGRRGLGYGHYLKFKAEYHKRVAQKAELELQAWKLKYDLKSPRSTIKTPLPLGGR